MSRERFVILNWKLKIRTKSSNYELRKNSDFKNVSNLLVQQFKKSLYTMNLVLMSLNTNKAHPTSLSKLKSKKSLITRKIETYTRPGINK